MVLATALLLQLFAVLSAIDGLYLHLWRFRLYRRPDSYVEHLWHTARAAVFVPILLTVFIAPTAGVVLWIGVALLAVDLVLGVADVLSEPASRASLGGLHRSEYLLHVVLVAIHAAMVTLALASRPAAAWALDAPATLGSYPTMITLGVAMMVPASLAVLGLHVGLAWRHRPVARMAW